MSSTHTRRPGPRRRGTAIGAPSTARTRRRPRPGSARVFKTLIASVDGRLAAAVVPVAHELDLKALAAALGGRKAALADPAEAQRATGYVVGGISPLGARRRLPAVLDASSGGFDTVFVSGGRRGLQLGWPPPT